MDNSAFVDFDDNTEFTGKSKTGLNKSALPSSKVNVYNFDEAAALCGTGKFHYLLMLVCGICFMAVMVETMGISIILPFLKCDLSSTISEQGLLASSGFLGIVISSHVMGFFADTWGRLKTLRTALVFGFITTVISAFSVNIWMLIVFRFLNGLSISGCQACVFSYLGEFHGQMTRLKYITMLSMFLPIGLMFLPGMATAILPLQFDYNVLGLSFTPWRALLLANSSLSLIALGGFFLLPESPKYDLIQGNTEIALQTFRKMFTWNTGRPESEYAVKQVNVGLTGANLNNIHGIKGAFKLVWSQTVPLFSKDRILQTMNICGIMFTIFAVSQGTFMWFPTMLNEIVSKSKTGLLVCDVMNMHGTVSENSTITEEHCGGPVNTGMFQILIIIGAVFTIVYLVFTFTIDIIGKKNLLLIWMSIAAISCLLIHWVSSYVLSIILLTLTLTTGTCGGVVSAISIEYFPTNISAMAMCLVMMTGRLGAVVGSNVIGLVIFTNCNMLFYIYVGIIVVTGFCSIFLPDKKKDKIVEVLK
ncbi:synaptic vesicle glycoprotein 2B [Episyrphus balteatus]|uniref:synaptic vesicle glycoprotein 2B n=1 Tax=Episyrphus balteatus TaxID=286459 RepID=UPI0024868C0B|nr:synaptic vesicle glycoprotein 2B [Episyrphus balteatus]